MKDMGLRFFRDVLGSLRVGWSLERILYRLIEGIFILFIFIFKDMRLGNGGRVGIVLSFVFLF